MERAMIGYSTNKELDTQLLELDRDREDGAAILNDVAAFLGRFIAYPSQHAQVAHTLWIAHCHLMQCWESTPRLALLSPEPGSGKTRCLEISELLVPRAVETVNMSPAYLFRKIGADDGLPTLLVDEVDALFTGKSQAAEEIRALLNSGHRRGATVGRCVIHGKKVSTEESPAFCAVALAGLGFLPDTLMSRSIVIRMRRRAPSEDVEPYRRRIHAPEGENLRDRLDGWATIIAPTIAGNWPTLPDGIADRTADCWEPLIAIADAVGGHWPDIARVAAVAFVSSAREAGPSLGIQLLSDLREIFKNEKSLPTQQILERLHALPESPWNNLRGKPLDDRGLAVRLRKYEIKPKVIRVGTQTPRGYERADLSDAWERYLPSPAQEAQQAQQAQHSGDGPEEFVYEQSA
jgi:hypothetical protein